MNCYLRCSLVVTFLFCFAGSLSAQVLWNVTNGNWGTAGNWFPAAVPMSGPDLHLKFFATGSYTSTHNLGAVTLNRLTISNTGNGTLTLAAGGTANTLTFAGADPTLDITGTTLFTGYFAGSSTLTKIGSGTFIHDSVNTGFTGTLIINEGKFINRADTNAVTNFNPVSIVVNSGGSYQFGNAGAGDPNLPLTTYITINSGGFVSWQETQTFGGFHLQGGTIEVTAGNATANGTTAQSWTSGTILGNSLAQPLLNIGGSAAINKTTSGTVTLTGAVAINSSGGLRIQDGTVVMNHSQNLGTAPLTFGAAGTTGVMEYRGASALRGGAISRPTNAQGVVRVTEATTVLTLSGNQTGAGSLIKEGAGALSFTGTLATTGLTRVAEGLLRVNPVTASGAFAVNAGAVLAVNSGAGTASFSVPSLTLADGSTLLLEMTSAQPGGGALLTVRNTGGLVFSNEFTLRVTHAQGFGVGTYSLLDYDGPAITAGVNLQLPGRALGELIYDTSNTRLMLDITGMDSVKWSGAASAAWDTGSAAGVGGTANWSLVTGGGATNFIATDLARFDDSAVARTVEIFSAVLPQSVTVDTALGYHFSGAGKISGLTNLVKTGVGTLVLATDNDYTGGTIVTAGTLQLGDGGTRGSVKGDITLNNSTLAFNRSDAFFFDNTLALTGSNTIRQNGVGTVTFNSTLSLGNNTLTLDGEGTLDLVSRISGNGVINKYGSGWVNLLGNSTFTGTLNIHGGTVQLTDRGESGDIDFISIIINSGGTFIFGPDANPDLPSNTYITVNEGGVLDIRTGESYGGVILNGGEYRASGSNTGANSTGAPIPSTNVVFDLRSGTMTTQFTGNGTGGQLGQSGGGVLAKTTTGTVTMGPGMMIHPGLSMQFQEGVLAMQVDSVPATGTAINGAGTPMANFEFGAAETEGTLQVQGLGQKASTRAVNVAAGGGRIEVVDAGAALTLSGTVTGTGSLIKAGVGTLNLLGNLASTGLTRVDAGTLRVSPGPMAGALEVEAGSTLAVVSGNGTGILSLPSLSLQGGSMIQLELGAASVVQSPLILVTGNDALTLGGQGDVLFRLTNTQPFATGVYTLLEYTGGALSSGFALEMEGRATGTLIYDTISTKISASITQAEAVRWTGALSTTWDAGSAVNVGGSLNWVTATSQAITNFVQTDTVHFDDSATNFSVQMNGALRPNEVFVNASANYEFTGAGKITGVTGLHKSGTGTLVLATDNDYTGLTTVSAGTLKIGNGETIGSIAGAISLNGGSLVINRAGGVTLAGALALTAEASANPGSAVVTVIGSGNVTLSGIISGTVGIPLQMDGSGTLYLRAINTFTGTTVINSGIVSVAGTTALGASTADVTLNGGTLQLTASTLGTVSSTARMVTIGPNGGTLDFWVNQTFGGNGFVGTGNVVKTGAGRWSVGANTSTFSGNILVQEGALLMTSPQLNLAKNLTVASGAQFIVDDDVNGTWSLPTGGKFTFSGDGGGAGALRQFNSVNTTQNNVFTSTFNRELVLAADTLVSTEAVTGTLSLTGAVTGAGKLIKQGPGTLRLASGSSTFSGGTQILDGTLLTANTTGSATGTGPVVMGGDSRLMGTGRITGTVTIEGAAVVQPGTSAARGTLTLLGVTTLKEGSSAEFRLLANGSNDTLVLNNLVVEPDSLLKVLLGYSAAEGDSFNLLDWTSLGQGGSTDLQSHLDFSSAILNEGLKWDLSLFNTSGILSVTIVPEPSRQFLLFAAGACLVLRRRR